MHDMQSLNYIGNLDRILEVDFEMLGDTSERSPLIGCLQEQKERIYAYFWIRYKVKANPYRFKSKGELDALRLKSRIHRVKQLCNRFSIEVLPFQQDGGELKQKFISSLEEYINKGTGIIKKAKIDVFGNKIQQTRPREKQNQVWPKNGFLTIVTDSVKLTDKII